MNYLYTIYLPIYHIQFIVGKYTLPPMDPSWESFFQVENSVVQGFSVDQWVSFERPEKKGTRKDEILLMEKIPNNHLGCKKPCE